MVSSLLRGDCTKDGPARQIGGVIGSCLVLRLAAVPVDSRRSLCYPMIRMISLDLVLSAFLLVFVAELGDKSQLVAFSLTASTKRPLRIFLASSSAIVLSSVLGALLGGVASRFVPIVADYAAIALFLGFGLYMIAAREPSLVKQSFIEAVELENRLIRFLPRVFKGENRYDYTILDIVRQEKSHAEVFQTLLNERTLFSDDINEDDELQRIVDDMRVRSKLEKLSFAEALDAFIRKERASLAFFRYLHDHLNRAHHDEPELQRMLANLIAEEEQHLEVLLKTKEESAT